MIEQYSPALLALLSADIDSARICQTLHLCQANILRQQASLPSSELQIKRRLDFGKQFKG
jgi:hypothetical protein